MIKLPIVSEWHVITPTIFRFLDAKYVDAFFNDGSLRLSSFSQFKKHKDEQRLDELEGETYFLHRTTHMGGQSILAKAQHGADAYVLCTTTRYEESLRDSFGCNSYMRINDPTNFAMTISRHIPGFTTGLEGICLYQDNKIIERDLGYVDIEQFKDPNNPSEVDQSRLQHFINDQMGFYPYFLKTKEFAHQSEYRLLWLTRGKTADFIDIKVPEAIQYCDRPNNLTK